VILQVSSQILNQTTDISLVDPNALKSASVGSRLRHIRNSRNYWLSYAAGTRTMMELDDAAADVLFLFGGGFWLAIAHNRAIRSTCPR
jgi:hypothetical protein